MGRYNIFCDEAAINSARYMLIGGLWMPWEAEEPARARLAQVRADCNLTAEMKWVKVSQGKLEAYKSFVDVFWQVPEISFKCIVVDTHELDYRIFHKNDKELGFYKFYFQLISRNLAADHLYWLYTDERRNRKANRLDTLKVITNRWWMKRGGVESLQKVEPRQSHAEDFIQLADLLLGAFAYAWNERKESPAKLAFCSHISARLGWRTLRAATSPRALKVNVWKWQPNPAAKK